MSVRPCSLSQPCTNRLTVMSQVIAVRAARVLVDSSSDVILDGCVVVDTATNKIVHVGSYDSLRGSLNDQTEVENLGDVTLMPGLFDCHVHLSMDPGSGSIRTDVQMNDKEQLELMSQNALRLLDAGVTTARDLGCRGTYSITLRDEINAGQKMGPRMLVANAPVTVPGGHAHGMGGEAIGVEDVTKMVQKRVDEGCDVVKVMTTGGFMTAGTHPSEARYTVEELTAMADTAHRANIQITTHAQGVEGIRRAVEAGFDCIEHCSWSIKGGTKYNAAIAQQIVNKGTYVCPTMNTACTRECYFCPWDAREMVLSNLSSLREAGAKMIVGTDAGIGLCHFERYADGLFVLQEAGYTPRQIIWSATEGAAEACGIGAVTGKLEVGRSADLVAFKGNPLEHIEAFTEPTFVMAQGRKHKLTPIAPFGDRKAEIDAIWKALRNGAGLAAEAE